MLIEHIDIWKVGGQVRDMYLDAPTKDLDFAVVGHNLEVLSQIFGHSPKMTFYKGFRTATLHVEPEMDFACTRSEIYPKSGKMPEITKFGVPIRVDLQRRDFTVNAIAINTLTGRVEAVKHAFDDLRDRQIRVLHANSFIDDPTRMLRAIRYAVDLDFEIEPNTLKLMNRNLFDRVSKGRIQKEIDTFTDEMVDLYQALFEMW